MKPVIKQEEAKYYVSESDIVKFVSENGPMEWNKTCDYVRDTGITSSDGDKVFWSRDDVFKEKTKYYNDEAYQWMRKFFNAHPFMEKVMIVFDD